MDFLKALGLAMVASGILLIAAEWSDVDKTFAGRASQSAMTEAQLGELAVEKGSSPSVKDFGVKMAAERGRSANDLKSIVAAGNIPVASDFAQSDRDLIKRLSLLKNVEFDAAFINEMVRSHESDIAEFEKEVEGGMNKELKTFAATTLPTLRVNLKLAKEIESSR